MFNQVILMGRITHDLELKQTQTTGDSIISFSIAVDRNYSKDKEKQTDFFNCTAFGKQAEFISNYFSKGRMILVIGRLQNDSYTDRNGVQVKTSKIMVDRATFTGEKREQSAEQNYSTAYVPQQNVYQQQPQQPYPQQQAYQQPPVQMPNQPQQQAYQQPMQQQYPQMQPQYVTNPNQAAPAYTTAPTSAANDDYPF